MKINIAYLNELLKKKNWSERKLACKTGLSQATVSRVLSGKRGVGGKTFTAIHKVFPEVPLDMLFLTETDATKKQ